MRIGCIIVLELENITSAISVICLTVCGGISTTKALLNSASVPTSALVYVSAGGDRSTGSSLNGG